MLTGVGFCGGWKTDSRATTNVRIFKAVNVSSRIGARVSHSIWAPAKWKEDEAEWILYVGQGEEFVAMAEELGIRSRREDVGKAVQEEEKTRRRAAWEFFRP
jgi:hypothetical protein